jgi:hypothetical protein
MEQPNDDVFSYVMELADPYAADNGGLVIMVEGISLGKQRVGLPDLPFGQHEILFQGSCYYCCKTIV